MPSNSVKKTYKGGYQPLQPNTSTLARFFYGRTFHKRLPRTQKRLSGHLREVVAYKNRATGVGFCTLCFCFPTKMLHLNAPFFLLKCSVSPKKSPKCLDNAHYTNSFFLISFKVYTYKNVQVLQVTTTTCTSS